MANAKDVQLTSLDEASFFLIGDSGSGKTPFLAQFPDIYVFDFDKGMASVRGQDVEYDVFKDSPYKAKVSFPDRGIYPFGTAWGKFFDKMQAIGDDISKGTCRFKTLGFDSATMMSQILMNAILKEDGEAGKPPQLQHYNAESSKLKELFDAISAWPIRKVMTVHIQRNTNDLQGTMEKLPLLTGKFAARSSIYFDEIYFIERYKEKDEFKTILRTQQDGIMKQARSRYRVPDKTEATWANVEKFAKAALGK